jgi:hypothetical protein
VCTTALRIRSGARAPNAHLTTLHLLFARALVADPGLESPRTDGSTARSTITVGDELLRGVQVHPVTVDRYSAAFLGRAYRFSDLSVRRTPGVSRSRIPCGHPGNALKDELGSATSRSAYGRPADPRLMTSDTR